MTGMIGRGRNWFWSEGADCSFWSRLQVIGGPYKIHVNSSGRWSSTRQCYSPGYVWQYPETFLIVIELRGFATGIYWVEAREAPKHTTMNNAVPQAYNYLAQSVNSVQSEKTA